jgi:hypothetical protein
VVVAVVDLASASSFLKTLGFALEPTEDADIVTATAGGVTVVLVGPGNDPAVRAHLEANGSGVQHIAIEVLNAGFVQQALAEAGVPLLTDVVVDAADYLSLEGSVENFEKAVAHEAARRGYQGVVCGHIHKAEMRDIDGILYCNDGDWVESRTALVEHMDGRLELIYWDQLIDKTFVHASAMQTA